MVRGLEIWGSRFDRIGCLFCYKMAFGDLDGIWLFITAGVFRMRRGCLPNRRQGLKKQR